MTAGTLAGVAGSMKGRGWGVVVVLAILVVAMGASRAEAASGSCGPVDGYPVQITKGEGGCEEVQRPVGLRPGATVLECGGMEFSPETGSPSRGGSGGLIVSKGVPCKGARRLVKRCLKMGHRPKGWQASTDAYGGTIVLSRDGKKITVTLAGGRPPGQESCLG